MPYKDLKKQREAARERQRRHREGVTKGVTDEKGVTSPFVSDGVTEGVTKEKLCHAEDVTPLPPEWEAVRKFITFPGPGMPRLERMQRIAGSLGKYQSEVFFGLGGLTVKDISEVIGEQPPLYAHPGR